MKCLSVATTNAHQIGGGAYLIGKQQDYLLYEYRPSFAKPLLFPLEKLRFIRRLRFLYELFHGGYRVYYLVKNDNVLGYCVVTPGGRRLKESTNDDIVLGPYFICPQYRGLGYAKQLVGMTLRFCSYKYAYAYDWIHCSNVASIKTSESIGMKMVGKLSVVGRFRKLVPDKNGNYIVFRLDKNAR